MKTDIIIPIKTSNERLPGKNTMELCGRPLYAYLFATLKGIMGNLGTVYVDSSDERILAIAEEWGFAPSLRPPEYNLNHIAGDDLIARIIDDMTCDICGLLHVTTPFLDSKTILHSIKLFEDLPEIDSVLGVRSHYNRFWFKERAINHDPLKLVRTQELVPVYEESDFYFFRKKSFKKYGKRVCGKHQIVDVGDVEALDIDTITDFFYAETLIREGLVAI